MFDQTTPNQNFQGGYQYNGFNAQPKIMNVLNNDEIKKLQQNNSQFQLGLTEKESLQAACNHRAPDGMSDTLVFDQNTGIARCTICGYEFRPIEPDAGYESIKDASDKIIDILQTIKIMYTELPAGVAKEYFQIIPLIGKIPKLFEYAARNFSKHEYNVWTYDNKNMGGVAMFQNMNNIFGASMNPGMNPGMGFQQPQPNMYAQPGSPVGMPNGNAFGYAGASQFQQPQQPMYGQAPQQGYTVNNPGFQYNPQQPQNVAPTVAAPSAPTVEEAAPATETVTQKLNV
jgi:hypothetical protein